jgi:hypothetical protein
MVFDTFAQAVAEARSVIGSTVRRATQDEIDWAEGAFDDYFEGPTCWICDGFHEGRQCPVEAQSEAQFNRFHGEYV